MTKLIIVYMDASSCYRKLEGLPEAFTGKPTPKEKLALATSSFPGGLEGLEGLKGLKG